MRTVLVASSKGGCGKSTVVTNLAACQAQRGRHVVVVDADPQGTSYHWCQRRPDNVPGVLAINGSRRRTLERVPDDSDEVLIDSAAGSSVRALQPWLEEADAVLVPILPSAIDLEATLPFVAELAEYPRVARGKLPVGLVGNRIKPWTRASQDALDELRAFPFRVIAQLRDTQAYVLLAGLGKGLFDYHSEHIRSHQDDWKRLTRWLNRHT